jgi:hypothetical protein
LRDTGARKASAGLGSIPILIVLVGEIAQNRGSVLLVRDACQPRRVVIAVFEGP